MALDIPEVLGQLRRTWIQGTLQSHLEASLVAASASFERGMQPPPPATEAHHIPGHFAGGLLPSSGDLIELVPRPS
jgi:hypothetical protein